MSFRDRLRRLPNSVLLYVTFALAIGAAVLATIPFEAPATKPVPLGEAQRLEQEAATSTTTIPPSTITNDTGAGTTTTSLLLGLETQPRVTDGVVECASPMFELTVPATDERVARNDDCIQGALFRLTLAATGGVVALLVGLTGRRLRLRRYEAIAREERRRLRERLRRRAALEDPGAPLDA